MLNNGGALCQESSLSLRHSIFIRTISSWHLFSTLLNPVKLVYALLGHSNMHSVLDFSPQISQEENKRRTTVFLILLHTSSFLLEIRIIIKISKNPCYPINVDNFHRNEATNFFF